MATAVYLVHYQHARAHHCHALRVIDAPASVIRELYRHLDPLAIDAAAGAAGIRFVLVRTWRGQGIPLERRLKAQKHHSRLCPVCNPERYAARTRRLLRNHS